MKYLKLILAGILFIISASQYLMYRFIESMVFWLLYSLVYLAIGVYQIFRVSSMPPRIFSLVYLALPLAAVIKYSVTDGFPQLTQTFYIVLIAALAAALIWEIVSLCLTVLQRSDEKKSKQR